MVLWFYMTAKIKHFRLLFPHWQDSSLLLQHAGFTLITSTSKKTQINK